MKKQYKIEEVKKIFTKIIQEEEKENSFKIHGNIFTIAEYYKSETLKSKLKLTNPKNILKNIAAPLYLKDWYNIEDKEIIVIINGIYERLNGYLENDLIYLLRIIFHEIRHTYQIEKMKNLNKFENFFIIIEQAIINNEPSYYKLNSEKFLIEIDADKNANEKIEGYLKKEKNISREKLCIITKMEKIVDERYKLYDPVAIYEQFNYILQKIIKKHLKESINPLNDSIKELIPNINNETYNYLKNILSNIYNQDGNYKSIKEIITGTPNVDKKIINNILCTKSFIKNVKINTLEDIEIKYMLQALEEFYQQDNIRITILKSINGEEQTILDLYTEKKIFKRLKDINSLRSVLMNILLNKKRSETNISLYNCIKKRNLNKIS